MKRRQSRWQQKAAPPNNSLSLLCKRDEFIFRSPPSESTRRTVEELPFSKRTWDEAYGVWRLAPTAEVFVHIVQLCQDYFQRMPEIFLHENLSIEEISEGRTLDLSSYYTTLQVERSASDKEIKKAYYRMAQKYHPDKNGPDGGKYFVAINRAYETLMNPVKRKRYNAALKVMERQHQTGALGSYRKSVFS